MAKQIYVNLPVKDLKRSVDFFTALGFTFNPKYTDENATCMIIDENIFAMLLVEKYFQTFTKKPVADATKSTEVLLAIACDSREQVDTLVKQALAVGGKSPIDAKDYGSMYVHGFEDLDGHQWELMSTPAGAEVPS